MKRVSGFCAVFVLGMLGASALHPKAGWIARQQMSAVLGGQGERIVREWKGATAGTLSPVGEATRALRKLCDERLTIRRSGDEARVSAPPRKVDLSRPPGAAEPPDPERTLDAATLREAMALTERGGRLDPDNGFFPTLRAVALIAARRDGEGLAALHDAAGKPRWDDGMPEESRAMLDGLDRRGPHSAIGDAISEQSLLLPHPAKVRALARIATALAIRREEAGDMIGGLAIRRDLRTLGSRIGERGGVGITRLAGGAIAGIALTRPGGAPWREYSNLQDNRARWAAREADWQAAATRLWGADEAAAFRKAIDDAAARKASIAKEAQNVDGLWPLAMSWDWGLFLLSATLTTVLVGAFFGALCLLPRLRAGLPASPGVRLGLWLTVAVAPAAWWGNCLLSGEEKAWLPVVLLGVSCLALGQLAVSLRLREWPRGLAWATGTVAAACLVALLGALATRGEAIAVDAYFDVFDLRCYAGGDSGVVSDPDPWWTTLWEAIDYGLSRAQPALAPLLILTPIVALVSRVKRVPVTVGVARGLARCALPVAALLTFVYALLVVQTARDEAHLRAEVRRLVTD